MMDIDSSLARLRALPVDPRLADIDAAVLDGLGKHALSGSGPSTAIIGMAAALALLTGIAGAAMPDGRDRAASLFPLGAPAALAPSTLLASAQ
ncbi:hypothetical protein [Sphingobium aquiterrae]|uniref:hypothetical protein n=1 Tax=Sphingobium aquiterrae TaxID=2038656 RepID=UPI003017CEF6